jgi:sulfatase maturation enzyme AslB (radical SAM superfamily)
MITQVCNLSCVGCTNYSDLKHSGYVSWSQGKEYIESWLKRIDIPDFGIMGGEPLINPECKDWLIGTRELMPTSQIRFTTNGLLLDQHWDIVDLMYELGNISFKITVHSNNDKLEQLIHRIQNRYQWRPINEFGIDRWVTDNNFRFHVKRPSTFIKTYRNDYATMLPWNSEPVDAFANCCQQTCPLLYQGKIYKCSTSGLLKNTVNRVAPELMPHWEPYIVQGLGVDCSDNELLDFINNFGKPHAQCGQCPDAKQTTIDHYKFVKLK